MSEDLLLQIGIGAASAGTAIAVLKAQMGFHAQELARIEKMIQVCFRRIDELRDRK